MNYPDITEVTELSIQNVTSQPKMGPKDEKGTTDHVAQVKSRSRMETQGREEANRIRFETQ